MAPIGELFLKSPAAIDLLYGDVKFFILYFMYSQCECTKATSYVTYVKHSHDLVD